MGLNQGTINNAYSTATVNASETSYMGGLVGINGGTISNAYSTGSVNGGSNGSFMRRAGGI